ncbi:hypothetical protein [Methylobacterium brachiatum]|uniref:hypothetical protein n=1 Tax=Methylobacterium brachiatum TaxID=269660 RepID=UPI000EFA939B|nr:hypothetical protein [Methylobacterium brachiatum]AYO83645.1 hypothetical protein EBB05_16150 [Methylobacterium brachiatum]
MDAMKPVEAVAVTDQALRVRVGPTAALKTAWKSTALNAFSAIISVVLLVLGYLQTVNVAGVLSPQQALLWTVGVNVLTILLRAYGTRPIVLDPPQDVTVRSEGQP